MANPIVYLVAIVLSFLVIFAAVSLYLTRTAGVSAACGDGMWNVALASLLLRLPMAFVGLFALSRIANVNETYKEGGEPSKAGFIGSLVVVLLIVLGVFVTEIYYTADTLNKPDCVQALKNATKTDDPLITTSTIIFSVFDALLVLLVILELAFTSCIFSSGAELRPSPEQQQESARLLVSRPSDRLLAVEITRVP
jgi:hypothetical protein